MSVDLAELLQYLGACPNGRATWAGESIEGAVEYVLQEASRCSFADPGWDWMVRHLSNAPYRICAELMVVIESVYARIWPMATVVAQVEMDRLMMDVRSAFELRESAQWFRWTAIMAAN